MLSISFGQKPSHADGSLGGPHHLPDLFSFLSNILASSPFLEHTAQKPVQGIPSAAHRHGQASIPLFTRVFAQNTFPFYQGDSCSPSGLSHLFVSLLSLERTSYEVRTALFVHSRISAPTTVSSRQVLNTQRTEYKSHRTAGCDGTCR